MASDDSSGPRPAAPIVLRIKLRYDDVEVMVQRFATNVGKSGLFLPTKSLQPLGAEIKFELRLADDTPALVGLGRVKAATAPDPNNPKATFGMAIELMRVTPQSRALILRMLERRREIGLPELGLPTADDIDATRRAEAASAAVSDPVPVPVPVPVPITPIEASPGEALLTAPRRAMGPVAVAKVLSVAPLAPEPPRRKRMAPSEVIESASGPVASVSVAVSGLDDDIDLAAAVARARALAGGGLDAELEALSEVAAVPLEISIEAASAALARQFGGSAVVRDRSARWAAPLAAIPAASVSSPSGAEPEPEQARGPEPEQARGPEPEPAQAREPEQAQGPEPEPEPAQARDPEPEPAQASQPDALPEPPLASPTASPAPLAAIAEPAEPDDEVREPRSFAPPNVEQIATQPRPRTSRPHISRVVPTEGTGEHGVETPGVHAPASEHHEIEPEQIADEIHQLDELDLEDVEHTELGEAPVGPGAFDQPGSSTTLPAVDDALLAARLEAQLAEAEAEADADDLGLAGAAGAPDDREAEAAYGSQVDLGAEPGEDAAEPAIDLNVEEFDDFEILSEADADDADLLTAHGEQEASSSHVIYEPPPSIARRPSELDFAARLELDDDSDMYFPVSGQEFAAQQALDALHAEFADRHVHDGAHGIVEDEPRLPDRHLDSAGHALAGFGTGDASLDETGDQPLDEPGESGRFEPRHGVQPIFDDPEPSNSFTLASVPSDSLDLDFPPLSPPEPAGASWPRDPLAGRREEPAILHSPPSRPSLPSLSALHDSPMEDYELEDALGALDVGLDELSIPAAAPARSHTQDASKSHPTLVLRQPAPTPAPSPVVQGRASVPTPSRAVRQTLAGPPGSGRVVNPATGKQPTGRVPLARATTDDGVVIDFDDDDDG